MSAIPGWGAVISAPAQSAAPGQTVVVSVAFAGQGSQVSGLQFDLSWDAGLDVKVAVGDPIRSSSKLLYAAALSAGRTRCVLIGANQNVIPDGEAVKLYVIVNPAAQSGTAQVHFTNLSASDPNGSSIGVQSSDINVAIQGSPNPSIQTGTVLNAASLISGAISPGEVVTLFDYFPPNTALLVNGVSAPIMYAAANQMNAVVPFGLDVTAPANVTLQSNGQTVATGVIPANPISPALFTQSGIGAGPGAILNQDYSINSSANPAAGGTTIMIFGTGFGALTTPAQDGQTATGLAPTALTVTATVGGRAAQVTYAGAAPGLIDGVTQINVVVPSGLPAGSAVPVVLKIGNASTQPGVTLSVQ